MRENSITGSGVLEIGGVSCDKLAESCKTPLYIYDEAAIERQLKDYKENFKSDEFETEIIYASKAFTCKAMLELLKKYGFSLDVVSGGELYLAEKSGFPMENIYFHGNNKTEEELTMAVSLGCKTVVVDNMMETMKLIEIAKGLEKQISAIIRINPGITAHTHKYIMTGGEDSKFGVGIEEEEIILAMIHSIINSEYVSFEGFHVHIGSQIFDLSAYDATIEKMMEFVKKIETIYRIEVNTLDLGGGFGVYYTNEDEPKPVKEVCRQIIEKCESEIKSKEAKIKKIIIEPGRSVIAESGYTLYKIGFMKNTPNKQYVFIDGGMTDNIRVALYDAKYDCDLANKMNEPKTKSYTVAGKCCESGDILMENAMLPEAKPEDLLVVYGTGAYGHSMSNNYNRLNKPAVVFVKEGKARVVLKREEYIDQMRFETNEEVIV